MICLYFDTSTDWIVVEVFRRDADRENVDVLLSRKEFLPREASYRLVAILQEALQVTGTTRPDLVIASAGPGSFTGIRIAVATARNLSQLWKVPCMGFDTLQIYADYYLRKYNVEKTAVILDGKMDRYFFAMRSLSDNPSKADTKDLPLGEIQRVLESEIAVHPELKNYCFSYTRIGDSFRTMDEDYPGIVGTSFATSWKISECLFEKFHYELLTPNYMRDTYATKTIPKST